MGVIHVTKENFDKALASTDQLVVVDFFATWCGPCKMLGPVVEQASDEINDVQFFKVDIDEEPDIAQKYQIMSVPTLLFFKNGEVVNKSVGAMPMEQLKAAIDSVK